MELIAKIDSELPRNNPVVARTSGECEFKGRYPICNGCDGTIEELRCDNYLGKDYFE